MSINLKWFGKFSGSIAILLLIIWVIHRIDLRMNGVENSRFLVSIFPFAKSLIFNFIILLLILLFAILSQAEGLIEGQ